MTREEAIKKLTALKRSLEEYAGLNEVGEHVFRMAIEALKQPEIILCKDCKHYHSDVWGKELGIEGMYENLIVAHNACDRWLEYINSVDPDGFCFLAERRTDD